MTSEQKNELINSCLKARENAYVPYSGFSVGAAVLTERGDIFRGCNIENASYPAGICAERTAVFSAVAAGNTHLEAIALSGGKKGAEPQDFCMPCGVCRQVMTEFFSPDAPVLIVKSTQEVLEFTLAELMPHMFDSLNNR